MKSSTAWGIAALGLVIAIVGIVMDVVRYHHTIGIAVIVIGILVAMAGVVMAFRVQPTK